MYALLRPQLYAHVQRQIEGGRSDGIDGVLATVPADKRGWEWQYLGSRRGSPDIRRLPDGGGLVHTITRGADLVFTADADQQKIYVLNCTTRHNYPGRMPEHLQNTGSYFDGATPDDRRRIYRNAVAPTEGEVLVSDGGSYFGLFTEVSAGRTPKFVSVLHPGDGPYGGRMPAGKAAGRDLVAVADRAGVYVASWPSVEGRRRLALCETRNVRNKALGLVTYDLLRDPDRGPGVPFPPNPFMPNPAELRPAELRAVAPLGVYDVSGRGTHAFGGSTVYALGAAGGSVRLPDIVPGTHRVVTARFSPSARLLAVALDGGDSPLRPVRVYPVGLPGDAPKPAEYVGHTAAVRSVEFFAGDTRMVTGSDDGTVKVWDVGTRECLLTLSGPGGAVTQVAVSPDAQRITALGDGRVRSWAVKSP
ncbi:MAG: hypothetical protein K2X87_16835 [Gemmataceae bacterium]|nr:hypothetical protein [Gemmataceae bacterium]